jgi:hypothetical protein
MSDAGSDYGHGPEEEEDYEEPLALEEDEEMAPQDALRILSQGETTVVCLHWSLSLS